MLQCNQQEDIGLISQQWQAVVIVRSAILCKLLYLTIHAGGGIRGQSEAAAMEQYAKTITSPVSPGE